MNVAALEAYQRAEHGVLLCALEQPERFKELEEEFPPSQFVDNAARKLYQLSLEIFHQPDGVGQLETEVSLVESIFKLRESEKELFHGVFDLQRESRSGMKDQKVFDGWKARLHDIIKERAIASLQGKLKDASSENRTDDCVHLAAEIETLQNQIGSNPLNRFFYTGRDFLADTGAEFVPVGVRSMRQRLKGLLVQDNVNDALVEIEDRNHIAYHGPLAGANKGVRVSAEGVKLLATKDPVVIDAKKADAPTIFAFILGLIGKEQLPYFLGWLKCFRLAMLAREPAPGHLLGLTGPAGCGKTQLISRIIVPAIGGRRANPRDYFVGGRFNDDLLKAEVLVMDDEDLPTREADRQRFKQRVKNFLYSESPRFEAKFQGPFSYRGLWRCVVACNFAEDDLRALPPVDDGTQDKLMYLKCSNAFPERMDDAEFSSWKTATAEELPGFLWQLERYNIPEALVHSRGMVKAYQSPAIMNILSQLAGWKALLELVDQLAQDGIIVLPWKGRAAELERALIGHGSTKPQAEKLLGDWNAKCGKLLSEASRSSSRVELMGSHADTNSYLIKPEMVGMVG